MNNQSPSRTLTEERSIWASRSIVPCLLRPMNASILYRPKLELWWQQTGLLKGRSETL